MTIILAPEERDLQKIVDAIRQIDIFGSVSPSGTWTPVFTFATPGDLSVVYTNQAGTYIKIGSLVFLTFQVSFTPTYTTSAGNGQITGAPFPGITSPGTIISYGVLGNTNAGIAMPAGRTQYVTQSQGNPNIINFIALGSAIAPGALTTAEITSGSAKVLRGNVLYITPG